MSEVDDFKQERKVIMSETTEKNTAIADTSASSGTNSNEESASVRQVSALNVSETVGSRDPADELSLPRPEDVGNDNGLLPAEESSDSPGTQMGPSGNDDQTMSSEPSDSQNKEVENLEKKENPENGNTHEDIKKQLIVIEEKVCTVAKNTSAVSDAITGYFKTVTDRMHQELEGYRSDVERSRELDVLEELIAVYDEVQNGIRMADEDGEKALAMLKALPGFISDLLFNHNVEIHCVNPGDEFSGRWHHAVRPLVATDSPELDGRIAEVVKAGFDDVKNGDKRLRPAWVKVYKLSESVSIGD